MKEQEKKPCLLALLVHFPPGFGRTIDSPADVPTLEGAFPPRGIATHTAHLLPSPSPTRVLASLQYIPACQDATLHQQKGRKAERGRAGKGDYGGWGWHGGRKDRLGGRGPQRVRTGGRCDSP